MSTGACSPLKKYVPAHVHTSLVAIKSFVMSTGCIFFFREQALMLLHVL